VSSWPFMSRHGPPAAKPGDAATPDPTVRSAPIVSIPGRTILGTPRSIRISFKLFDRPNRL
jgi:hypothetical protein